jgi:acyl transferase domain-containing protein
MAGPEPKELLGKALVEIRALKARVKELEAARREPIAVVGYGCRFPGAPDPEGFWKLLRDGVDAVREVPRDRFDIDAWYDPDPDQPGRIYTRSAAFLDRVDGFDPGFFSISPREVANLSPQQRLLLEVAWEALEDAGYAFRASRTCPTPTRSRFSKRSATACRLRNRGSFASSTSPRPRGS